MYSEVGTRRKPPDRLCGEMVNNKRLGVAMSLKTVQRRLIDLGYPVGKAGADGEWGPGTEGGVTRALDRLIELEAKNLPVLPKTSVIQTLPSEWLPAVKMQRIHAHWTAGSYHASDEDREHYHILWEGDGKPVRGKASIACNVSPLQQGYAAHTLNANSYAIGVSLCCMAGAVESPFDPGKYPMTLKQWDCMVLGIAQLCDFYQIAVTPTTVLSHAEVQANLGIKQRGKWDYTRLAFDPSFRGAKACGNKLRSDVLALLK